MPVNQFRTALVGGYLKEEVDQRLEEMAGVIARLKEEARLREEQRQSGSQEEQDRIARIRGEYEGQIRSLKEQLAEKDAALQDAVRQKARTQEGDVRRIRSLERQLSDAETQWAKKEDEYRQAEAELREKLRQRDSDSSAAARVLALAEREAEAMLTDARMKALVREQKALVSIDGKRRAAQEAMEEIQHQIALYLEAFKRTEEKLTQSFQELGLLVRTLPEEVGRKDPYTDAAFGGRY